MTDYFRKCYTAEEGKKLYRDLAKKYHYDNGGNEQIMKDINSQFSDWWKVHKDIHYNQNTKETYHSEKATKETVEEFIDIIMKLSTIPDIQVEICGSWLWITGNTYKYRQDLKLFGCRWSKSKKKWYWTKDEYKSTRFTLTEKQRRLKYGSQFVKTNDYKRILID